MNVSRSATPTAATYSSKIGPTSGRSNPMPAQVRVGQRDLRGQIALRRADVDERPVVLPRESCARSSCWRRG